jgi:O-antigen ligase
MGALAALGVLLGLAVAAFAERPRVRAWGGASVVLAATALYFTFSRGALVALAAGLVVALWLAPAGRLAATALLLALPAGAAVAFGASADALTRRDAVLAAASRDGHRTAVAVLVLCGVAAAVTWVAADLQVPALRWHRAYTAFVVAFAVLVLALFGGRLWDAFAERPAETIDLNERFSSLSGAYRSDMWAAALDEWRAHPVAGGGAGSFERWWLQHRDIDYTVEDAHSLYLETLAETGVVGLLLLAVAIGAPFAAAGRVRAHPLPAVALAAYAAFLVHAALDWDWEVPALTLTALLAAAIALAGSRRVDPAPAAHTRTIAAVLASVAALAAFGALVGNLALADAEDAVHEVDWARADGSARRAETWLPWSEEPWLRHADAAFEQGRLGLARERYRRATREDAGSWQAWLGLARTSSGAERAAALRRAELLDPRERAVRRFASEGR